MPTLKAIHICNSHQPTLQPKIAKEYVFANADRRPKKNTERTTACIRNSGFSGKSKVSAFNKSLYQTESVVLFIPLLLIHANRCTQAKNLTQIDKKDTNWNFITRNYSHNRIRCFYGKL